MGKVSDFCDAAQQSTTTADLVLGRGISRARLAILLGVLFRRLALHGARIESVSYPLQLNRFLRFVCKKGSPILQFPALRHGIGRRKKKIVEILQTVLVVRTYETFFCVHSRSARTSRASCMPSANRARDFARRACACFCRSRSSRCLALRFPEL